MVNFRGSNFSLQLQPLFFLIDVFNYFNFRFLIIFHDIKVNSHTGGWSIWRPWTEKIFVLHLKNQNDNIFLHKFNTKFLSSFFKVILGAHFRKSRQRKKFLTPPALKLIYRFCWRMKNLRSSIFDKIVFEHEKNAQYTI